MRNLEGHTSRPSFVSLAVHLAHPELPNKGGDFVRTEAGALGLRDYNAQPLACPTITGVPSVRAG